MRRGYEVLGIYFLLTLLAMMLLCSCKDTEYVTVPVPEYHEKVTEVHDTIKQVDSILNEKTIVIKEADSIALAKLGLKLKNAEKAWLIEKTELLKEKGQQQEVKIKEVLKVDSIRVPYPVERKLSKWESFCLEYGKITLGGSIFLLIAVLLLAWLLIKKKKK